MNFIKLQFKMNNINIDLALFIFYSRNKICKFKIYLGTIKNL